MKQLLLPNFVLILFLVENVCIDVLFDINLRLCAFFHTVK